MGQELSRKPVFAITRRHLFAFAIGILLWAGIISLLWMAFHH